MAEEMLHKVEMDWLLCIYGALLTDKQREIARLYYEEDYSLGEIALQESVSRQSIHDTLQRVEKQLRTLEEKLAMKKRLVTVEECIREALGAMPDTANGRDYLEKALRLLNDEEEINGL